jgi:hypothetical protein
MQTTETRKTSIDAYYKIKQEGLLSKRRMEVYEALYEFGPLTANELVRHMKRISPESNQTGWNARFSELQRLGVIHEVGVRCDEISGNQCIVWDVTDQLPSGKIENQGKTKKMKPVLMKKIESLGHRISPEWKPELREIWHIVNSM